MTNTRIADNVAWHIHKEAKKQPKPPKPRSKIDTKFEEWAAKNKLDLRDIPVMRKKNA